MAHKRVHRHAERDAQRMIRHNIIIRGRLRRVIGLSAVPEGRRVLQRVHGHAAVEQRRKVGVPGDLYCVETMLSQIEVAKGFKHQIGLEALIETALGMANVEAIAAAPGRLEAMHFGVGDYAAFTRARTVVIGGLNPDYPGDQWHYAISRMNGACRAYGLRAIDGPFGDFSDPDAYVASAKRAAALGIEGKWAIHPSQIKLANEMFSPPEEEVTRARRIIEALREAEKQGKGAANLDGRLIDAASERMAQNVLAVADAIAAKG